MKQLVDDFLYQRLSRRQFVQALAALGVSTIGIESIARAAEAVVTSIGSGQAVPVTGTGGELLVAQMKAAGIHYVFTNPGSFEAAFFDALLDQPTINLILGLHEGVVIAMADGYQKASGKPAFVNLHAIGGTAQALGQLYNSSRDHSSLVVTAGLLDNEVFNDDLTLAPRPGFSQKDLARQFSRSVAEVRDARAVPLFFRRALKVAMAEPGGPTYLGIPNTVLHSKATSHIFDKEHFLLPEDIPPRAEQTASVVKLLLNARSPALILGDEVARAGAQAEALELAELFGMPVFESPLPAFHCFPRHHPLFKGRFDGRGKDVVIDVGNYDLGDYGPGDPIIPPILNDYPFEPNTAVVRIGLDTDSLGRNYPFEIAVVANVKLALASIIRGLRSESNPAAMTRMRESRWNGATVRKMTIDPARVGNSPMNPDELSWVLDELLDRSAIIVNENLGASNQFLTTGFRPGEKIWIGNSGKSLGWGIGAAIGAKLAQPARQVVCDIGDGSVMYSAAGFWTQSRYGIPVLTVVSNNRNYQTVRLAFNQYGGQMARTQHYPGLYLGSPDIDFVQLAASQGVAGIRAKNASELRSALKAGTAATNDGRPFLVEALVQRTGPGAASTWFQPLQPGQSRKLKKPGPG